MTRALFISQDFPPAVGGIQTYSWEIARRLADRGLIARIIVPSHKNATKIDATLDPLVQRIAVRPDLLPLPLFTQLPKRATSLNIDVSFHAQWQTALPALRSRRKTGFPRRVVVAAHGRELLFDAVPPPLSIAYGRARRHVVRNADLLLPVSGFTAGLLQNLGAPDECIEVINNGTDADRFSPVQNPEFRGSIGAHDRPVILAIGRIVRRKGFDTVIEAMPRVLESLPDALLAIAGEGPFETELRALVDRLGLKESVHFCGGIPYEDLPDVYSSADVVAMPSRNEPPAVEGFGIVFLEANACERPVIGAATGGIPDAIVDGETGVLVPPDDPVALAGSLIKLLADAPLRERLGRRGRQRVLDAFTWDHVADRVAQALIDVSSR